MADPFTAGAAIGAGGQVVGSGISAIGQGRNNKREAAAAAGHARTVSDFINSNVTRSGTNDSAYAGVNDALTTLRDGANYSTVDRFIGQASGPNPFAGDVRSVMNQARNADYSGMRSAINNAKSGDYKSIEDAIGRVEAGDYSGLEDLINNTILGRGQQMIQENILASDTRGLESQAMRTLNQRANQANAQLAARGIYDSGAATQTQRQLTGETLGSLASAINQDQFQRAGLAQQSFEGLTGQALQGRLGMMGDRTARAGMGLDARQGIMQDRTQRSGQVLQGETAMMGDRTARVGIGMQGATSMLADSTNRLGIGMQGATSKMSDQLARQSGYAQGQQNIMGDLTARDLSALDAYNNNPAFGYYDTSASAPTNQGK